MSIILETYKFVAATHELLASMRANTTRVRSNLNVDACRLLDAAVLMLTDSVCKDVFDCRRDVRIIETKVTSGYRERHWRTNLIALYVHRERCSNSWDSRAYVFTLVR